MQIIKDRVVSIDYTLTDKDNLFIDSTLGADPLDYLHGYENIIPALEQALEGRLEGDSFSINIPAAEAYGERNENLVMVIPRDNFDPEMEIEEGMQFNAQGPPGSLVVTIVKVEDEKITIDGNHPLAGMDLNFDVIVTGIRDALPEEIAHGHPHATEHSCEDCEDCADCESGCACQKESLEES